jgi:hypothetical protein
MQKVKKPPGKEEKFASYADIKTESEDSVLSPQNQPPQTTEPPKEPLPISQIASHAETSRSSNQEYVELILLGMLGLTLGMFLGDIFAVLSGLAGLVALFKE